MRELIHKVRVMVLLVIIKTLVITMMIMMIVRIEYSFFRRIQTSILMLITVLMLSRIKMINPRNILRTSRL